jgi:hypothetical protein
MRKTITYSTFAISLLAVVILFVTAKSYTQLAFAVILYPAFAYFVLKLFPREKNTEHEITLQLPINNSVLQSTTTESTTTDKAKAGVADVDKRDFLKLIGVAGVSFFLFSLFSKKAQIPFFGKMGAADNVTLKNAKGIAIDPAERQPMDGFQISEIDDSIIAYYGFTNKNGEWFIMKEDTESSSFRYIKGEKGFPESWSNRTRLKYDYFYNI